MDLVIMVLVVVAILAYYGFMRSVETGARMANREVEHLSDVHEISLIERTAKLNNRINDSVIKEASEVQAKLKAMRQG